MKPIFSGNSDIEKSAFMNWRTSKQEDIQNMLVLAEGFCRQQLNWQRHH